MAHSTRFPGSTSRPSARPWWEDPVRLALFRIETLQLLTDKKLSLILRMETLEMAILDDLEDRMTKTEGASDSTIMLLNELSRELKDAMAAQDPARVQAVIARMDADQAKWAAAVAANPDPNP